MIIRPVVGLKIIIPPILLSLLLLVGCQGKPSKHGTAGDHIKYTLKDGVARNNSLGIKHNVPKSIKDALMPGFYNFGTAKDNYKQEIPKTKFNIAAESVPAKAFFLGLVEGSNINIVVHPDVSGSISLTLKEVSIPQVLAMVERVYGYTFEIAGMSVKVFPATLQSRTYKVNYLDMARGGRSETRVASSGLDSADTSSSSDDTSTDETSDDSTSSGSSGSQNSRISTTTNVDFWTELRQSLLDIIGEDEGRKVSVSPMSGQIIVVAMPSELRDVEKFLKDSELTLNRQVILEAKILEVELNDGYRSGINWGLISGNLEAAQIGTNLHNDTLTGDLPKSGNVKNNFNLGTQNTTPSPPFSTSGFGGILSLGLNFNKFSAFIELLSAQGNVQVLSSPRVSTTNNQKALIKVGEDKFFVTNISSANTSSAGTTTTTTAPTVTFDSFFSGIALDVMPNISEEGYVTLHVHPTVSTVSEDTKKIPNTASTTGQILNFPLAKVRIRESDSIVRARDGELVVIGGLMQERTEEMVTGVPGLMNLPFLGKLFRHTRQTSKKSELVILIRPIIVGKDTWNDQLEQGYSRFESLDRGFHFGGSPDIFGTLGETF